MALYYRLKSPASLYELIIKGGEKNRPETCAVYLRLALLDMEGALTTRGQVLMYGPPGTERLLRSKNGALVALAGARHP